MLTRPRGTTHLFIGLLMLVVMSTAAAAQEAKSAALAKELTALLDAAKLTAIAAKDSSDPEAFVAAMYFSGSQLLIVSAKYTPAVLLNQKLGAGVVVSGKGGTQATGRAPALEVQKVA